MPYIAIKSFPKDEETKRMVVEKINLFFLETWGCSQEAITISLEEIAPDKWDAKVKNSEILSKLDKMMIIDGKKNYGM